jgi:putative restriction endonuclease
VIPGDVVLSYAGGAVQGAGFAASYCYTCPRPEEFGHIGEAWDLVGWRVDVRFQRFASSLRPKDHLTVLRPLLAREDYAPLRATGDGLQHVYLTTISTGLAEILLGLAGADAAIFRREVLQDGVDSMVERQLTGIQEWEVIEQRRIADADLPNTTRTALIKARVGQGLFKERVGRIEPACRITFVDNPAHLIGSHIKPWRECTNEERLEGANGLLLTPSADHLFDRGFISFDDDGELLVSGVADVRSLKRMGADPDSPPSPLAFNRVQRHFLEFHRREVFLGAGS